MISYGSLVVLATPKGKRHIKRLKEGGEWQSHAGRLLMADIAAADYGQVVFTNLDMPMRVEEPTLFDLLLGIKRQTQIIYPKDIAWLCLMLGAGNGRVIVEAGCGSGGLTLALSWFSGASGRVVSHDARPEFVQLARRNLDWAGLGGNVELHCADIADGFKVANADALFLDVREPWLYLEQVREAVKPGASAAFLVPTANQMEKLLLGLEKSAFGQVEINEIFIRQWKPLADRLRPKDRMIAHTGFLVFCRQEEKSPEFEASLPQGTRERKQLAAKQAREAGSLQF